jgi:hypothetical protein
MCNLVSLQKQRIEIKGKILFGLEGKKEWFGLFRFTAKQQKSDAN